MTTLEEQVREILSELDRKMEYYGVKNVVRKRYEENPGLKKVQLPPTFEKKLRKYANLTGAVVLEIPFDTDASGNEKGEWPGYLYPEAIARHSRNSSNYNELVREDLRNNGRSHPIIGVIDEERDGYFYHRLLTVDQNALGLAQITTKKASEDDMSAGDDYSASYNKIMPASKEFVECMLKKILEIPVTLIEERKLKLVGKNLEKFSDFVKKL